MNNILRPEADEVFSISYLPVRTPHREIEIKILYDWVRKGVETRNFKIPVIYGPSGTGKTMVARKILDKIKNEFRGEVEVNLVNSLISNTTYSALKDIGKAITEIPERGLSISEMIRRIYDVLVIRDIRYIVVIDDADELIRKERGRIIEILTRIEEEYNARLIYPIIILRNLYPILGLSDHIKSKIGGLTLEFKPYTWKQLEDIVRERIELGFYPETITSNSLRLASYISHYIYRGNAREMINLIFRAGILAENYGSGKVSSEHIRLSFYSSYSRNIAPDLSEKDIILIKAIAKALNPNLDEYLLTNDILVKSHREYQLLTKKRIIFSDYKKLIEERLFKEKRILYKNDKGEYIFFYYPVKHILSI